MVSAFLDTTVLAVRAVGRPSEQRAVEQFLRQQHCCASRYVLEQFKATFLRTMVVLHNLLKLTGDEGESMRQLHEHPHSTGDAAKATQVAVALQGELAGTIDDKIRRLEMWIETFDVFAFGVERVDSTGCELVGQTLKRNDAGLYELSVSCSLKSPKDCHIERYWETRRAELVSIAKSAPEKERLQAFKRAASEVVDQAKLPRGKRCTVPLSDAVIASTAGASDTIATTNVVDFEFLTRVLPGNRRVVNPVPPAPRLVRRDGKPRGVSHGADDGETDN